MPARSSPASDNVTPLRAVRVLVATRDRRYLAAATFLLDRHGFAVEGTPNPADVVRVAERTLPDVVVLDVTGPLAAAARAAAAIEGNRSSIRVVLVSEADSHVPGPFAPLPKWSSPELLVEEIRRVYGTPGSPRSGRPDAA